MAAIAHSTLPKTRYQQKATKASAKKSKAGTSSSKYQKLLDEVKAGERKAISLWNVSQAPKKRSTTPKSKPATQKQPTKEQSTNVNSSPKNNQSQDLYPGYRPTSSKELVQVIASSGKKKASNEGTILVLPQNKRDIKISETMVEEFKIPQQKPKGVKGFVKEVLGAKKKNNGLKAGIYSNKREKAHIVQRAIDKGINPNDLLVIPGVSGLTDDEVAAELEAKKISKARQKNNKKVKLKTPQKAKEKSKENSMGLKHYVSFISRKVKRSAKQYTEETIKIHEKKYLENQKKIDRALEKASKKIAQDYEPGTKREVTSGQYRRLLDKKFGLKEAYNNQASLVLISTQRELVKLLDEISSKKVMKSSYQANSSLNKIVKIYNDSALPGYEIVSSGVSVEGFGDDKHYVPTVKFKNEIDRSKIALKLHEGYKFYKSQSASTKTSDDSKVKTKAKATVSSPKKVVNKPKKTRKPQAKQVSQKGIKQQSSRLIMRNRARV